MSDIIFEIAKDQPSIDFVPRSEQPRLENIPNHHTFHVPLRYPRLPQPVAHSQSSHVLILLTALITTYYWRHFSQINSMARPKLTLFLDVVSPFGYMAFYMTRV